MTAQKLMPALRVSARVERLMANRYYPLEEESEDDRVRLSISLSKEQHAALQLIELLWNALDDALGRQTGRKWKISRVVERFVSVGIKGFWDEVGGEPAPGMSNEEFIRQAVDRVRRQAKKK